MLNVALKYTFQLINFNNFVKVTKCFVITVRTFAYNLIIHITFYV